MVDHILNIPRLVLGFGVKCLNWILQNHIYEVIPRMEQKLYRSRHLIPMVIGTPCKRNLFCNYFEEKKTVSVRVRRIKITYLHENKFERISKNSDTTLIDF